jgi:hypothetical protein
MGTKHKLRLKPKTAFGRWMIRHGKSTTEIAEALGCTTSAIYAFTGGEYMPGTEMGWAIQKLTGCEVPFTREAWKVDK